MGLGVSPAPELILGLCHQGPKNSSCGTVKARVPSPRLSTALGVSFHTCVVAHLTLFTSQLTTWNTFKETASVNRTKRQTCEPFL